MSRSSSARTRASGASDGGVGLGIALAASSPARSPLRRRRSQTDSEHTDGPGVSASSSNLVAHAASERTASAAVATPQRPQAVRQAPGAVAGSSAIPGSDGLAPPPPVKRGRGRPRKHPLPPTAVQHASSSATPPEVTSTPGTSSSLAAKSQARASGGMVTPTSKAGHPSVTPVKAEARPSNGRAAASRHARASAAAELNRRALAALEQSISVASGASSPPPESSGPAALADVEMEEIEQALPIAARHQQDGTTQELEATAEEAEEMASRWREEYYEIVEQLPLELTRCFTLVRETEGRVQNRLERIRKASQSYYQARRSMQSWVDFYATKANGGGDPNHSMPKDTHKPSADPRASPSSPSAKGKEKAQDDSDEIVSGVAHSSNANGHHSSNAPEASTRIGSSIQSDPTSTLPMSLRQRVALLYTISAAIIEARRAADEKVELVRTAFELVDRHVVRLDADLARNEVGLALGLRTGTEESRGAREAHGALAMAQVGEGAAADANGTGSADAAGSSSAKPGGTQSTAPSGQATDQSGGLKTEQAVPSLSGQRRGSDKTAARTGASGSAWKKATSTAGAAALNAQAGPSRSREAQQQAASGSASSSAPASGTASSRRISPAESSGRVQSRTSTRGADDHSDAGSVPKHSKRRAEDNKGKGPSPALGNGKGTGKGGRSGGGVGGRKSASGPATVQNGGEQPERNKSQKNSADSRAAQVNMPAGSVTGNPGERWCYCQEESSGDMVECDNKQCPLVWYHFDCVGLTFQPVGKWYCLFCKPNHKCAGREVPPNAKRRPPGIPVGGTAALSNAQGKR